MKDVTSPYIALLILTFATVFFGGVHVWVWTLFSLAMIGLFLLFLWRRPFSEAPVDASPAGAQGEAKTGVSQAGQIILDPPSLAGLFFVAWGLLQLLPLPPWLLRVLSPTAAEIWSSLGTVGADVAGRLSLYPLMTVMTLLLTVVFLLFYWFVLYGIREKRHVHGLVWGVILLGVIESLYGLVQLAGDRNVILWWENSFSGDVLTGTFINRNHLAGFLSMAICVAVGYLWSLGHEKEQGTRRRRRLYQRLRKAMELFGVRGILVTLSIALMTAALLASASRGGLISLVCGLVFMLGLLLARYFRTRKGFVLMVALSLVLTYVGYFATDRIAQRFAFFFQMEDRLAMTRDTLDMARDFPLFGSGGGTFEHVYPRYQQTALDKIVDYAHNDWVQLAAEYGWPGFIVAAAALAAFLLLAVGRWRLRHDVTAVGIGLGGMGAVITVAVHSLSDFNLHIPANGFLLALILAVTWRVLYFPTGLEKGYVGPLIRVHLAGKRRLAALVAATALLTAAALVPIQVWRADTLARTFRNSTLAFSPPTAEQLRMARQSLPGNAAYWLWSADRLHLSPQERQELLTGKEALLKDPERFLLLAGLKRNPSDRQIWHRLGWYHFLRGGTTEAGGKEALGAASQALLRAAALRPADARLQMDAGNVSLYAYRMRVPDVTEEAWREAYRQAVKREPKMAGNVADALALHLGPSGPQALKNILPPDPASYLGAASFLLFRNHGETGMDLVREGERLRLERIERLWADLRQLPLWGDAVSRQEFRELAALDRSHPGVLLFRGNVAGALRQIERRGDSVGAWWDRQVIGHFLRTELDEGRGDPALYAYHLGRIVLEEDHVGDAAKWFRRSLSHNSQNFSAWLHLHEVMQRQARTSGDQVELDTLKRRIALFAMPGIVPGAWKGMRSADGLPAWRAPFRVADRIGSVNVRFAADGPAAWALYLNDRFVEIWQGPAWEGEIALAIPPGEHEFRLITWQDAAGLAVGGTLPFRLEVDFDESPVKD